MGISLYVKKEADMWFFSWLQELFLANTSLIYVIGGGGAVMVFATLVGCLTGKKDVYLALLAVIAACYAMVLAAMRITGTASVIAWSVLVAGGAMGYLFTLVTIEIVAAVKRRRERRREILRKLQYTLPDRDNAYVRARLNTALGSAALQEEERGQVCVEEGKTENIRLEHVRKLLARLKEAPLTKAERLETEEMSKIFTAFLSKPQWTAADVRLVNEMFSCLLKMSAKYSI